MLRERSADKLKICNPLRASCISSPACVARRSPECRSPPGRRSLCAWPSLRELRLAGSAGRSSDHGPAGHVSDGMPSPRAARSDLRAATFAPQSMRTACGPLRRRGRGRLNQPVPQRHAHRARRADLADRRVPARKPGKGGAFVRTKLKASRSAPVVDQTFRAGEKFARIRTETKNMQYLYDAGDEVVFMDEETYEQLSLPRALSRTSCRSCSRRRPFRCCSSAARLRASTCRASVVLEVTDTEPGVKGDTVSNVDEAGDARDRRGRPGAAVRQRRRQDQGRPAREALHLAGLAVGSHAMPRLVDTSIRVLSQEPLAGADADRRPASRSPRSSTGRASPTSRSRAAASSTRGPARRREPVGAHPRAQGAHEDAARARASAAASSSARGPVGGDFARRFVASAAESGIDVFRLHDPLNDVDNLREAAEAIVAAGREFDAGLLYGSGRHEALVEAAERLPRARRRPHPPRTTRPRCCSRTAPASSSRSCARSRACRSASTARAPAATRSRPRSRRRAPAPT